MPLISAVIPIFYPSTSTIENIKSYAPYIDVIYIIYNSPIPPNIEKSISDIKNTFVLYRGENIGISKALNLALDKAHTSGYKWLLTIDQDSSFPKDSFQTLLSSLKTIDTHDLIIFSPIHNKKFQQTYKKHNLKESPFVMTSGNLVNISLAKLLNGYDENLFIDEVDHEFCFRATQQGYRIVQDTSIALNHHLGEVHQEFLTIKLYPPIRLYYMIRNYLYLRKKYYYSETYFFQQRDTYLFKFMLQQMIYGKQKFSNIVNIYQGIKDYRKKQYGKYNHA